MIQFAELLPPSPYHSFRCSDVLIVVLMIRCSEDPFSPLLHNSPTRVGNAPTNGLFYYARFDRQIERFSSNSGSFFATKDRTQ